MAVVKWNLHEAFYSRDCLHGWRIHYVNRKWCAPADIDALVARHPSLKIGSYPIEEETKGAGSRTVGPLNPTPETRNLKSETRNPTPEI